MTITELRERISALRLDPTDDTDANNALLGALVNVAEAAKGLSTGQDWNNGTMAKTHGYRQKLLDALVKLEAAK